MKFAFIANIPGVTPETYSTVFETAGSYNLIAGVDGMDAAKEYVAKLAEEGFELLNLCGDFDDEITAEIREIVGPDVEVKNAGYTKDEFAKMQFLKSFKYYGMIIMDEDVDKPHEEILNSEECVTRAFFVKDLKQAKTAAKKLIEQKVDFIELCSWFDLLKTMNIVDATENLVPVGSCGELDPDNLD